MASAKPKTTLITLIELLADIAMSLEMKLTSEEIQQLPVKIAALKGKPYVNIGPFWIKSNAGSYDIYVWDKIVGALSFRVKVGIVHQDNERQSINYKYAEGFGPDSWLPPFKSAKDKEDE